jgi:hypothetical protein
MNRARAARLLFIERASPKIIEETRQYIARFRPRSRDNADRARTLQQVAGALSGSGQSGGSALVFAAWRQTVI